MAHMKCNFSHELPEPQCSLRKNVTFSSDRIGLTRSAMLLGPRVGEVFVKVHGT